MFAFVGYVLIQVFDGLYPWNFVLWFVGANVAHDLIAFPLYTLVDRIAQAGTPTDSRPRQIPAINYLRVPAIVSGMLFVVWFPLILRLSESRYEASTGQSPDIYLGRWLAITGALFAASAVTYAVRLRHARRAAAAP